MNDYVGDLSLVRFVLARGLAAIYLLAFVSALNQFRPLLGERGLLPVPEFLARVSFREAPSVFHLHYSDRFFAVVAWSGTVLAACALVGVADAGSTSVSFAIWIALYLLYLSIVNVGQTFYAFGWESMLLEAGFFAAFLGPTDVEASPIPILALRFMLFRVELGAGLIKIRHDPCWRDLTCLYYHHETQPLPNPLSAIAHRLPSRAHRMGVVFSHFVQLVVPFGLLAPAPYASVAAGLVIAHQLLLVLTGNYAWLNWLTIVLGVTGFDDATLRWLLPDSLVGSFSPPAFARSPTNDAVLLMLAGATVTLGIAPVLDLFSKDQRMNYSYNPLHLVGSYGAFGSVTRVRHEIVIEGTDAETIDETTVFRAYEFWGKPGDPRRRPPQIAPYHLRLDWAMWFLPLSAVIGPDRVHLRRRERWFTNLVDKLLEGDRGITSLFRVDPFAGGAPRYVRAVFHRYEFAEPDERRRTGVYWKRTLVGEYLPPTSARSPARAIERSRRDD